MRDMLDEVREFVRAEARRPFEWGVTDCASMTDRWAHRLLGFSPLAAYGRKHRTAAEGKAWLAEPGGIAAALSRVASAAGVPKTQSPIPGDVGLVFGRNRLCAAIHVGDCWFSRDEDGLIGAPHSALWWAWAVAPR